ncbi:MAG: hypothetical protein ACPLKP_00465 [Microgenomates group bacterium]
MAAGVIEPDKAARRFERLVNKAIKNPEEVEEFYKKNESLITLIRDNVR